MTCLPAARPQVSIASGEEPPTTLVHRGHRALVVSPRRRLDTRPAGAGPPSRRGPARRAARELGRAAGPVANSRPALSWRTGRSALGGRPRVAAEAVEDVG